MSNEMDNRKIAILKPDYLELQRETRATRKRLRRAKSKKDNLLAEVRFLRHKLRMLKRRDSNPKWKGYGEISANQHLDIQSVDVQFESPSRPTTCKEDNNPQGSSQEDYSIVNGCHASHIEPLSAREFQVFWEPLRAGSSTFADALKRSIVDKNGSISILKPSIYKDRSSGFVTPITAKRTITRRDQLSLKV